MSPSHAPARCVQSANRRSDLAECRISAVPSIPLMRKRGGCAKGAGRCRPLLNQRGGEGRPLSSTTARPSLGRARPTISALSSSVSAHALPPCKHDLINLEGESGIRTDSRVAASGPPNGCGDRVAATLLQRFCRYGAGRNFRVSHVKALNLGNDLTDPSAQSGKGLGDD